MRVEPETGEEGKSSEPGLNLFGAGEQEIKSKNRGKVREQLNIRIGPE